MIPRQIALPDGFHAAKAFNREQWLTHVAVLLRPWFTARGFEIPLRIRLGVGSLSSTRKVLGVCHTWADRDGFRHITISPFIDDPLLVTVVLTHELIHAVLPEDEVHGRRFGQAARALGLLSPVTQPAAGPELHDFLVDIVRRVGPYPHKAPALLANAVHARARAC
ncbi:hypothetical protein ASE17_19835 [Phenylobacterium sp. Root77]|jgi:hypothetical protein|uniref:hypothetical protein n=1 Tax=unclassified Phenylobacterium TaxID=2640670 RepID=UPI0006F45E42|nr:MULTISPECIES: hypothetical protein [unclassified Phenylobacterium]KQW66981.1 hypothetical protein ASC73_17770 [Phenylobacterium sp. Root1277]KQW89674.1 hypothetical protein ASC79_18675 [Phenylobacterium sp. Root1290]KRC43458.1 hypothetical protein ASE17_19835 [Phenylobacterium sp. Root77]